MTHHMANEQNDDKPEKTTQRVQASRASDDAQEQAQRPSFAASVDPRPRYETSQDDLPAQEAKKAGSGTPAPDGPEAELPGLDEYVPGSANRVD